MLNFHTFHSLALSILEEEGVRRGRFIGNPVFHDRLLDSLLDGRPELAARFGGEARPRALASALRASLKDLMDAGVEPGEVREHFGGALGDGKLIQLETVVSLRVRRKREEEE